MRAIFSQRWRPGLAGACLGLALAILAAPSHAVDEPPPTADGEPPPEALVGEIPFHPQTPLSRVMIDLAPDGQKPFTLYLDTGASFSIITPLMARSLGVNVRRNKSSEYRRSTRLGRDLLFWVDTSSSDTGVRGGGFEIGVLGANFLDDYVVEIDYPGRMVRFYDPKQYAVPDRHPSPDVHVMPFKRNGTRILVDVSLEGNAFTALLDTGAPDISVLKDHAKRAGIPKSDLEEEITMQYVTGPSRNRVYQPRDFRIGGLPLPPTPILIELKSPMNVPGGAIVGYDAIGRYVMRIDYPRKRISLSQPAPDSPAFVGWLETYRREVGKQNPPPPTEEEIAAQDAARLERFEKAKAERLYARSPGGGFVVVDGYRLRQGPKEGETWYTHEEMLAIRADEEAASDQSGSGGE